MAGFTDSPFEALMQEIPRAGRENDEKDRLFFPEGDKCAGCAYGRSSPCIGACMKEILEGAKKRDEKRKTV